MPWSWIQLLPSVDKSSDIPDALTRFLDFSIENASDIQDTLQDPGAMDLLRQFSANLQSRPFLTTSEFRAIAGSLKDATKRKGKLLFHPIRAALTMKSSGPELDKLIPMIETAAKLNLQNVMKLQQSGESISGAVWVISFSAFTPFTKR